MNNEEKLYQEALEFLDYFKKSTGEYISVSAIQRRFRIGYMKAARILDRMEKEGYVSEWDGANPRKIL
jgi:DNA segregation ATPase FtsK/SpoIIIE, S-DNA-T family